MCRQVKVKSPIPHRRFRTISRIVCLKGTYVSVEPFHLQAYADEQCFRFNNRTLTDAERFTIVMSQIVGRRLTYNELTGKTESQAETRP